MLIEKIKGAVVIKFNKLFYDVNSIIAANTDYEEEFSNEVNFTFSNFDSSMYHIVKLTPRSILDERKVFDYINLVLKNENNMSDK